MAGRPGKGDGSADGTSSGAGPVTVCRRLQLVAALLAIVGVLGLVSAVMVATAPAGEGLDSLLPVNEADVTGQVRTADGYLIEGATVTYAKGGLGDSTGPSGWYFLEGVDTGRVVLRMEADGYKTVEKTVRLERGKYTVDFLAELGTGTVEVPGVAVPGPGDPGAITWAMATGMAVASAFALLGAASAYLRRWYFLVVLGCVLGLLSWGWFAGSVISMVALVIALPLRKHFGPKDLGCEVPWHEPPPPDLDVPEEGGSECEREAPIEVTSLCVPQKDDTGPGGIPPDG